MKIMKNMKRRKSRDGFFFMIVMLFMVNNQSGVYKIHPG